MKKIQLIILAILLLYSAGIVSANFDNSDKKEIANKMTGLIKAVNNSDATVIYNTLSPNVAVELKKQIQNNIVGQKIKYQQNIGKIEELSPNTVRVSGKFAVQGSGWNMSGASNYFIFEKVNEHWYLLESNFAQKLSSEYVMKSIGKILIFAGPIFLLIFAFWIWMIIDVSKRPLQNKTKWLLIVVLLNWFGAILYFFIARRKHIKSLKQR